MGLGIPLAIVMSPGSVMSIVIPVRIVSIVFPAASNVVMPKLFVTCIDMGFYILSIWIEMYYVGSGVRAIPPNGLVKERVDVLV